MCKNNFYISLNYFIWCKNNFYISISDLLLPLIKTKKTPNNYLLAKKITRYGT